MTPRESVSQELEFLFPCMKANGHAYGDAWLAAKYCGLREIPSHINGEWQHGHIIPERNIHPEFVIGSDGLSRQRKDSRFYVARQDQVDYLKSQGYTDVHAIGMPIVYAAEPMVERIRGSLLVMPMHTLADTSENFDEIEYAKYIHDITEKFSLVVCCIHKSCQEKRLWIETFNRMDIEVVLGADEEDANSLNRMAYVFKRFEYVTSNEFGSQLAYSAYFGAKPSIAGPKPHWQKENYENTVFYRNVPALLDILDDWRRSDYLASRYPFLYVDPIDAVERKDWADIQLGFINRKSAGELTSLFKWTAISRRRSIIQIGRAMIRSKLQKYSHRGRKAGSICKKLIFKLRHRNELRIFTHLTFNEKYSLYKHAGAFSDHSVFAEIGSYLGSSSCFIASAIARESKLYCIDTWGNHSMIYSSDEAGDPNLIEKDSYNDFIANTIKYRDKIIALRGWSYEVVDNLRTTIDRIDFLFIDGDHNYGGVKQDWNSYRPLLRKDSIVVFHETGLAEGVQRIIAEEVIKEAVLICKLPNMEIYKIK